LSHALVKRHLCLDAASFVSPVGREGYGLAYFLDANDEAEIAELPGTYSPGEATPHPPMTAGAHLAERLDALHSFRRMAAG
jgi:hypothetical protein